MKTNTATADSSTLMAEALASPNLAAPSSSGSPESTTLKGFVLTGLRYFAAYGLLPNLLFIALGHFVYLMRPLVNADYFLVAGIAPFVGGAVSFALFALLFANELFINIAPLYHFQIVDAIRWLGELRYVNGSVWIPSTLKAIAISGLLAYAVDRLAQLRKVRTWPMGRRIALSASMLVIGAGICTADIVNGTSFVAFPVHISFADVNIAYSGVRRSVLSILTLAENRTTLKYHALSPAESGAGGLLVDARAGAITGHPQIALVVVESMGVFRDPALTQQLLAPLTTGVLAQRYRAEVREVPFDGHTIEGEFRELCGVQLEAYGEQNFPKCLPAYLSGLGYETTGLHGFTNQFYNRYRWYPMLGFDHIQFAEEMQAAGINEHCGSGFKGICDASVAEILHQQLLKPGKPQFVYWMTLNSHLPLDAQVAENSTFDCNANSAIHSAEGPCLHSRAVSRALESIAAVAADPKLPPTEFIIVGDHMPPFLTPDERAFYSPTTVPAIILKPTNGQR